jgi:hypothetical protein
MVWTACTAWTASCFISNDINAAADIGIGIKEEAAVYNPF